MLTMFFFRSRNQWPAYKKMIPRYLSKIDPETEQRFYAAFNELFSLGNPDPAIALAEDLLSVVGGPITDGFRMTWPPQARLPLNAAERVH